MSIVGVLLLLGVTITLTAYLLHRQTMALHRERARLEDQAWAVRDAIGNAEFEAAVAHALAPPTSTDEFEAELRKALAAVRSAK